jgi:two-component system, OmpR family, sensor kinase
VTAVTDPRDATVTEALAPQPEIEHLEVRPPAVAPPLPRPRPTIAQRLEAVPLRARLVAILVILLVLALAVSGLAFLAQLHGMLQAQVDGQLRKAAKPVAEAVLRGDRRPGGLLPSNFVVQVNLIGSTQAQTIRPDIDSNLPASNPAFPTLTVEQAAERGPEPFTVGSETGSASWRVVSGQVVDRDTGAPLGYVLVATPLTQVDAAVASLRLILLLVVLVITAASAVLGWLAIRRSFQPLVEVEETAAAIAAGDLSRRVPERPASTEVGRLTRSLNGMLTQIESAFRAREASEARTRRFAADASHELRTPLVSIRGFAELYRQGAVPADEVPRTMRRIEDEAKRMGSLVEDLLLLARLDEQRPGRHEPVDLAVLAGDAVHDARGLDAARPVTLAGLNGRGPQPAVVTGDEDRLRQVVANLVANAVRHTPEGTPIEVAVGQDGGSAVLEVRDHGHGLPAEQVQRVFERFYRVDSSRRRGTGGGSGLGLSIVAAVVAAHGGDVQVLPTPGGGATFRVAVPARSEASGPGEDTGGPPAPAAGPSAGYPWSPRHP